MRASRSWTGWVGGSDVGVAPDTARGPVQLRRLRRPVPSGPPRPLTKRSSQGMVVGKNCSLASLFDIVRVQRARAPRAQARASFIPISRYM
eukprot:3973048-Pleurochrysis_carterae.AAC.1